MTHSATFQLRVYLHNRRWYISPCKEKNGGYYELCTYCGIPETVEHFLIDCPGQTNETALKLNPMDTNYNASRNISKYKLKELIHFLKSL